MRKKYIYVLIFSITIVSLIFIGINFNEKKENSVEVPIEGNEKSGESKNLEEMIDYIKPDEDEVVIETERPFVSVFGESNFETNNKAIFRTLNWDENIPDNSKFILVSFNETIDKNKQIKMQQWIKEKKTVFFYGFGVEPKEVKEKLGMDVESIVIKSEVKFPYLLYGYGYSFEKEKEMPIFLGSNTPNKFEEKVSNFLYKNRNF